MTNYWRNKSVLVTGGGGFIGSHFVEELLKIGAKVICVDRTRNTESLFNHLDVALNNLILKQFDLLDDGCLRALAKDIKIDVILNCAALDGNSEFKIKNAGLILDVNTRITLNILNFAKERKIKNIVLMSSAEIYPKNAKSPITEENDYRKHFDYTENGYILSKKFAEIAGELYRKQFDLDVFLPRPTNAYGPRDKFDGDTGRVIPNMIKKALNNQKIEIWGDGSQIRSFIYVKDLVRSILKMVEVKKYHLLNIATDESISILNLAKLISKLCQSKEDIFLRKDKPVGMKRRVLSVSKLNSLIDFIPKNLEAGLKETINWYKIKL